MRRNGVKRLWDEGKPAINGWLSLGSPFASEVMGHQDFDSITADIQHGVMDYSMVLAMFQALSSSSATLMARVPWLDPAIIMKVLDLGALGIICPMVNNREEAERLVSYCRYPPLGNRSYGPTRANFALGSDYYTHANDEVITIAMVETAEGMANLDAIASTPGIDGIYVGPSDLALSTSRGRLPPSQDRSEPEMLDQFHTIVATCRKHGIKAAIHCSSAEYGAKAVSWGYDLVTVAADIHLLARSARAVVARARELIGTQGTGPTNTSDGY